MGKYGMPTLRVAPTTTAMAEAAADYILAAAREAIAKRGYFTIALSGGSTPIGTYQALASPRLRKQTAWDAWYVFFSDERCVPPDHPDSNYRMAMEALLGVVGLPSRHIFRMQGELQPLEAAEAYALKLRSVFGPGLPHFDLVLLGLGEDGHVASLFPDTPALAAVAPVAANWVPAREAWRITLTLPAINAAEAVAMLASGERKAPAVRSALSEGESRRGDVPAARVRPATGALRWFLDQAAATLVRAEQT